MFSSVRIRLMVWYAGVSGVILLLVSVGVYHVSKAALHHNVEVGVRSLGNAAEVALRAETVEGESLLLAAQSTVTEINLLPQEAIAVFSGGRLLAARGPVAAEDLRSALGSTDSAHSQSGNFISVRSLALDDRRYDVVVAHALSTVDDDLAVLRRVLLGSVPAGIVLAGVAGWFLAQKALHPIAVMFDHQRQFMTDASHELRTPLSVISSAAEVTLDRPQRAEIEYREALTIVHQEAQRLRRLVDDMFTRARADAGQVTVQRERLYLDEVVVDAVRAARVLAADRDVTVGLTGHTELPYLGDESMLRRLMLNLLDNAVRHSPPGGAVQVNVEKAPGGYAISVKDTGDGSPPAARQLIFTRFYQANSARTHSVRGGRGAGLGLPIARWVAEAHNGSLDLQDSTDPGSTFVVALPYERASA